MLQYEFLGKACSIAIGVFDSEEDAANLYKNRNRFKEAAMDAVDAAMNLDKDDPELLRIKEIINTERRGFLEKVDIILIPVKKY